MLHRAASATEQVRTDEKRLKILTLKNQGYTTYAETLVCLQYFPA